MAKNTITFVICSGSAGTDEKAISSHLAAWCMLTGSFCSFDLRSVQKSFPGPDSWVSDLHWPKTTFEPVGTAKFCSRCLEINCVRDDQNAGEPMRNSSAWTTGGRGAPMHFGHWGGCASRRLDHVVDPQASGMRFTRTLKSNQHFQCILLTVIRQNEFICWHAT